MQKCLQKSTSIHDCFKALSQQEIEVDLLNLIKQSQQKSSQIEIQVNSYYHSGYSKLTQYNRKKKQDVTTKCYRKICHYLQVKSSCSKKTVVMITIIILSNSEKAMAPHSSTLAWKTPWTEEPGRLQSMGLQCIRHD